MKAARSGGGWKAIGYTLRLARRVGWRRMWSALRSKNACKTCAVGMGGQLGGMVNEGGYFPEVCKKSVQAMASDMQPAVPAGFFARTSIHQLRALSSRDLEHAGRLVEPLVRAPGDDHYRPISWDEALERIVSRLRESGPDRSFFYASGRSSNEAGFLLQLLARLFGTNYVNNCSYYCHQASGVGLASSIGTGAGTVRLEDLDQTDLYVLIGANPASNHPRLMRSLLHVRRRGGQVVVINPVREVGLVSFRVPSDVRSLLFGSKIASLYVQPHIGGDLALLAGVAKAVLERNGHDAAFIANHTEGFDELRRHLEATPWTEIAAASGVEHAVMDRIAGLYLAARNVVFGWAMGITHHAHGTDTVRMIANVALLRGMVGRRGAGVMPIRGHSNVQGMGSVGVTPALKQAILERFEQRLGVAVPRSPGYDTMACMQAASRGEMHAALCLGGNLYGSNPDARFAAEALGRLKLIVYLSTTLNTGHAWGTAGETLILPVLPRDEEPQPTTQESMFSYVRLSDGGPARFRGPRSEVSILSSIGRLLLAGPGPPVDWNRLASHAAVRELIGELIPGYEALRDIDRTRTEFHVTGRTLENYRFPTPGGKARFHAVPFPPPPHGNGRLRLMTVRSEGQFNTVVYDTEDVYRGQERRDVILMNALDLERLGLEAEQRVRVESEAGEMRYILARPFDIRPGNALMYYPEANALVPAAVDPHSRTPAFKSVAITVRPEETTA
ncbi:MAG TPA: FdhF/YdeP family oxidoreductase [Planctomycetaceae bacterium]|nr:FdhF/YdeP family oxidoreductase [Planctomycetaceae bacterium]